MMYGLNDYGEGVGWMGMLVDGLIDRYMDGLVDGDDSIDVVIDGYIYMVYRFDVWIDE